VLFTRGAGALVAAVITVALVFGIGTATPSASATVPAVPGHAEGIASPTPADFWLATAHGDVWAFGAAGAYGSPSALSLAHPVVGITPTDSGNGYWLVASDGGVFAYGDAGFYGSTGAIRLNQPVVGMVATPDGGGYWLVASDGGIFTFGDAGFYGSTGAIRLNQPVVGMAPTPDGGGYWLVASDGGIFAYGDARFHGSTGAIRLSRPIVGMSPTADGTGYWMVASDGGIFAFGNAGFFGSMGAAPTPDPAQKIVSTSSGKGYWIVDQNGTGHAFGDADGAPPPQGLMFGAVTPGDKAVLFALAQLGKPYIWGGNGPAGYDCSGLTLASWKSTGVSFARVANDQYHTAGQPSALADLQTGDLVFWGSNQSDWTSVYHTGLYVGGGRTVEATGDHVQLDSLGRWGGGDLMPMGRRP
jgi:hypothetical protein